MQTDMSESVAIITGAGRGIGRATAQELSRAGYRLALVARTREQLIETQRSLATESFIAEMNVTDDAAVEGLVQQTLERFGRIDAIINNAGSAPVLSIEQTTP